MKTLSDVMKSIDGLEREVLTANSIIENLSQMCRLLTESAARIAKGGVSDPRAEACATLRAIKIFAVNGMEEAEKFGK